VAGISLQHLDAIKQRFFSLNRDRLARLRETLRSRQRDVIDTLPLLFHVNHPALPGFVSEASPVGVCDFAPSTRAVETLVKMIPEAEYKRRALARYDIHALYLMGSSGTIAYSSHSDFDVWLCHDPELSAVQLADLHEKARMIERWAAGFDLEVHIFVMNADQFREGRVVELSHESSGSAQHHLLLDEFYRTSLLLAGRYPIWWLVPAEQEANYPAYTRRLIKENVVRPNETVDFGGLPRAPAEEFFGASLWQLYKSIDSPYKAVLKLMLMEAYAAEYPDVDLLSVRFKRAVHEDKIDPIGLDPYIMLYRRIEEFLLAQKDDARLALLRRCFYFKVNERIERPGGGEGANWRAEVMGKMAQEWGWSADDIEKLNARNRWKIHDVLEEHKNLVSALTRSYHALSRFARNQNILAKINQDDLNMLGRKLYAAFERKAGKIEIINRGISDDTWESHLTIHQVGGKTPSGWVLHRGIALDEERQERPLKRSRNLVELLAWCYLNQIVDERTAFGVFPRDSAVTVAEVRAIIKSLEQFFPGSRLPPSTFENLSQHAALTRMALFINVGVHSETVRLREGKQLTSSKTDALSYGGVCENHVLSIDQLVLTSWQEVLAFRYDGDSGLFDCLAAYLKWSPPSTGVAPPLVRAYSFSSAQAMTLVRRVEELFSDVVDCYYTNNPHAATTRYVMLIRQKYYVLRLDGDGLVHDRVESYNDLLKYLAQPVRVYSPVVIDRYALMHDILPMMYRNNKPGVIQIYYVEENQAIYLYIIDERGSLFYRRVPKADIRLLIAQYQRFLAAVANRQRMQRTTEHGAQAPTLEVYQGHKKYHGKSVVVRCPEEADAVPSSYVNMQVITGVRDDGNPEFTIYIDDKEFSSLEYGDALYQIVAQYIIELRKGGSRYPIYITDIDLAHQIVGLKSVDELQSVHYLEYKRQIEDRLNAALASMVDGQTARVS
jgi:adenylate cyclase class 1